MARADAREDNSSNKRRVDGCNRSSSSDWRGSGRRSFRQFIPMARPSTSDRSVTKSVIFYWLRVDASFNGAGGQITQQDSISWISIIWNVRSMGAINGFIVRPNTLQKKRQKLFATKCGRTKYLWKKTWNKIDQWINQSIDRSTFKVSWHFISCPVAGPRALDWSWPWLQKFWTSDFQRTQNSFNTPCVFKRMDLLRPAANIWWYRSEL